MTDDIKGNIPEALVPALIEKATAEAARAREEARGFAAEASVSEIGLQLAQVGQEREAYKRKVELSQNVYHHTYNFTTDVNPNSVSSLISTLQSWVRMADADGGEKFPIEIAFCSPGGSVIDGMALFDFIQTVRASGHEVTTSCIGWAASMAGILLQAGDKRVMNKQSWLMIHQASFGAQGPTWKVEDMVKWVSRVQDRILDIFAERAKLSGAAAPITRARIKKNWERTDWYVSSEEALKWGLVDELR